MNSVGLIETLLDTSESRLRIFADPEFRSALFAQLNDLVPPTGVLSLDIFDTLILRDHSSELRRFVEVGSRMARLVNLHKVKGVDAFLARQLGTKASYRCSIAIDSCREGSLTEIHRTASRLLIGNDKLTDDFVEAELLNEAERTSPNTLILDYVTLHRARGGVVILISDMYMHADQIRRLLRKLKVDEELFNAIFSSADIKVSKTSGGVFSLVETAIVDQKYFLHVGDQLRGDFQNPRRHGWKALHLPVPQKEILARQNDHFETMNTLSSEHGIVLDIAMPQ
jgi:predicted HAD superfamily hydrolase